MEIDNAPVPDRCDRCGWPEDRPFTVVSEHATQDGRIVYTRCVCGRLQVRRDTRHARPLARGHATADPDGTIGPGRTPDTEHG